MGYLEKESRKRSRKTAIQRMILETASVAGVITVAALAPNVIGTMGRMGMLPNKRQKEIIQVSRKRLIERGLLEYKNNLLSLTEKGEQYLRLVEAKDYSFQKPKKWDKKWRVLIFDIPEERKGLRDKIRATLISVGFIRLQDSVWLYPYDCENLITLLKADFKVGKDMLYLIVDSLENDISYRKKFSLLG